MAWSDWWAIPAAFGRDRAPATVSSVDMRVPVYYAASPEGRLGSADFYWSASYVFATVVVAVAIAAAVTWFFAARKAKDENALGQLRKGLGQLTETVEDSFRKISGKAVEHDDMEALRRALHQRVEVLEESIRRRNQEQEVGDLARRNLAQKVDNLEKALRTKAEDEENLQRMLDQRLGAIENGIQVLDGRQLDQEATNVTHRGFTQRLESVEKSVSVIGSQATSLVATMDRGSKAIDNLQRRVSTLPKQTKLRSLSRVYERRMRTLERRIEKTRRDDERFDGMRPYTPSSVASTKVTQPELSLSPVDMQEIAPTLPSAILPPGFSSIDSPSTPSLNRHPTWRLHQRSYSVMDSSRSSPALTRSLSMTKAKPKEPPPKWTNYYKNT